MFRFYLQAMHKDIKVTFNRAPAAGDAYVSSECRWDEIEDLFANPMEPCQHFRNFSPTVLTYYYKTRGAVENCTLISLSEFVQDLEAAARMQEVQDMTSLAGLSKIVAQIVGGDHCKQVGASCNLGGSLSFEALRDLVYRRAPRQLHTPVP